MENMITSVDQEGPFGSPFVDSERTKVTEETKQALQIIYFSPATSVEEANKQTKSLMDMFLQIHGGEGYFYYFKLIIKSMSHFATCSLKI